MIQVDYLVKITDVPADLKEASEDINSALYNTYRIYQMLVDSNFLWRVWYIDDEYDQTWVEVNFINDDGESEFHTIMIDEGTYVKVEFDNYHVLDSLE